MPVAPISHLLYRFFNYTNHTVRLRLLITSLRTNDNTQIFQLPITELVEPTVDLHGVPFVPRVTDDIGLGKLFNLSGDVCLNECLQSLFLVGVRGERTGEFGKWGQPTGKGVGGIRWRSLSSVEARSRASTVGVPDNDDVIDFQMMDGVVENRLGVIVVKVELAGGKALSLGKRESMLRISHLAMLRWTKISPGVDAVRTDSGTRESAQPIHRI